MTSLSGQFTTFSKVVICAMMIRGRHRGLPYALDRAIMLPGEREMETMETGESIPGRKSVERGRRHDLGEKGEDGQEMKPKQRAEA